MPSSLARLALVAAAVFAAALDAQAPRRHLLIVVDGLRPDYVTSALMPHLTALGQRGVVFNRHHSVYPTVTRVNAASLATGSYPEAHGLLGNSVFFPRVDPSRFLDTADYRTLQKIAQAETRLLSVPTLGDLLQRVGRRMLVVGSGSAGSAFLLNPALAGGAILHGQFVLPEAMGPAMKMIGPVPAATAPPGARDRYAVDAFLKVGLKQVDPAVAAMWLGELDATSHDKGVGHPDTVETLRRVDGEIKRVQDGLTAAGVFDQWNIWVTSDHGFSTYTGGPDVSAILAAHAGTLADGSPKLVSGAGAIYVRDGSEATVTAIVAALQRTKGVGAIFTPAAAPDSFNGRVRGTLSFDAARWQHDRSAQILYSPDWTDEVNAHGMRGASASNGVAGHGSTSPWDIHNTLVAAGPDLRHGLTIDLPSANADLAPTWLTLLGLPVPMSMQGRPLDEALAAGRPSQLAVQTMDHTARTEDGSYAVTATFSIVRSGARQYRYFDSARATRR